MLMLPWLGILGRPRGGGESAAGDRQATNAELESQPSFALRPVLRGGTVQAETVAVSRDPISKPWRQDPIPTPSFLVSLRQFAWRTCTRVLRGLNPQRDLKLDLN